MDRVDRSTHRYIIEEQTHCLDLPSHVAVYEEFTYVDNHTVYKMNTVPRGYCLVISMRKDREIQNQEDVMSLRSLFEGTFKFTFKVYEDLTKAQIDELMVKMQGADHSQLCCFVMFILAHGIHDRNESACFMTFDDMHYKVSTIEREIESIPGLVGKPKLLFLNMCEGKIFDCGNMSDFLISFAGIDSPVAWRGRNGSTFIQSLCDVFSNHYTTKDVGQLMVMVTERVVAKNMKQYPALMSTLTKYFYFGKPPHYDKYPLNRTSVDPPPTVSDGTTIEPSNYTEEWLKEGMVNLNIKRVQMLGLPGSGKTCSQRLLLNEDPPEEPVTDSTPIACRAVKATRISAHDDRMERVDAKALLSRLAHDLKEAAAKQKNLAPENHNAKSKEEFSETEPAELVAESASTTKSTESADTTETEYVADDTEANIIRNEIVKAIPNAKGKFDSHLVYIIDSGGQTAFQELLPLFTRAASFNIITLDLSKDIDEKLKQEYRINGKSFSCDSDDSSEVSYTTNIEFLKDVLSSGAILQPYQPPQPIGSKENTSTGSTTSPQYAEYFVLGTHKDKAKQEVIKNYNDELKKLKSASKKEGYHIIRDGEIYPVNTMIKSPDRKAEAEELCKIIYYNASGEESKVSIPVRWFAFELTLLEKAKGSSFLLIKDVFCAGKSLQMTEAQTKEALRYLHNVTIILYYPQVLPDVVFVDPHPILDILSRLLALVITKNHHPFVKEGVRPSPTELKNLKKNGLFTKALLEKLKDDEDFPKSDFIKLLLHLHIIVETDEQDEYFLPSALPPCPKTSQPPESGINPLQIIWRSPVTNPKDLRVILPVPRGIFSLAVIKLMKCSKPLQFCFPPTSPQYLRCRDAMSFRVFHQDDHIGTIHIIKKHKHIEIYFEGDASKYCSLICEAVKEAITSSCEAINIKPDGYEFAFACPSSTDSCYCIVTNENEKKVKCTLCTKPPTISGEEKYWSWFDKKSLTKVKYPMMTKEFDSSLLDAVKEALTIKSIDDVKRCLLDLIKVEDWVKEVDAVTDEISLEELLQQYCFLSNLSLLKYITEKLDLKESKSRIDQLAEERDAFYSKVLAEDFAAAAIEDHKMMKEHHVEMTVVVSWSSSETTLATFQDYITKEFKDLSMFIALRAVHHSWLTFVSTIPIWAIAAIIRTAFGLAFNGIEQFTCNNEDIYVHEVPIEPGRETNTQQQAMMRDLLNVAGRLEVMQHDRYRLAITVLMDGNRVATQRKVFLNLFETLRNKLGSYPLAVAFTIEVLERSHWGDTESLRQFASSDYVLDHHVDLCLIVDDFYSTMDGDEFNSQKILISSSYLNSRNVSDLNRSQFVLELFIKRIISPGDVSKIKGDSNFFDKYISTNISGSSTVSDITQTTGTSTLAAAPTPTILENTTTTTPDTNNNTSRAEGGPNINITGTGNIVNIIQGSSTVSGITQTTGTSTLAAAPTPTIPDNTQTTTPNTNNNTSRAGGDVPNGSPNAAADPSGTASSSRSLDLPDLLTDVNNKFQYGDNFNEEIIYRMNEQTRGYCLIIHMSGKITDEHPDGDRKSGNSKDVSELESLFQSLKFAVKNYPNLTKTQIDELMAKVKGGADYNHLCCFVMFILAHGNETSFTTGDDKRYKVSTIKDDIQSTPGLVGKPKLLFLQTCRGSKIDEGVDVEAASSDGDEKIPSYSDFLLSFATIKKYRAYRIKKGSYFILCLCGVFKTYSDKYDIMSMMTIVTKRVADEVIKSEENGEVKQNPEIISTLRKFLYLGRPPTSAYDYLCNEKKELTKLQ